MIKSQQDSMSKAVFALILHTLQESDSDSSLENKRRDELEYEMLQNKDEPEKEVN